MEGASALAQRTDSASTDHRQSPRNNNPTTIYNWMGSAVQRMKMVNAKEKAQKRKQANRDCRGIRKGRLSNGSCGMVSGR